MQLMISTETKKQKQAEGSVNCTDYSNWEYIVKMFWLKENYTTILFIFLENIDICNHFKQIFT